MTCIKEKKLGSLVWATLCFSTEEIDRVDKPDIFEWSYRLTKDCQRACSPRIDLCSKNRASIGSDTNCLHDAGRRVPRKLGQRCKDQDTPDACALCIGERGGKTRRQYFVRISPGLIGQ